MLRTFDDKDARRCCAIINDAIRTMDGLNDAARRFIYAKTVPNKLTKEFQSFHTIVFEEDGAILGFGALDGDEIKRVYTTPGARGRGVGTAVMEALESEARRRNLAVVEVESALSAIEFYTKCGYTIISPAGDTIGEAEFHHIIMGKSLT